MGAEPLPHSISQWVPQRSLAACTLSLTGNAKRSSSCSPLSGLWSLGSHMGPCCPCHSSLMCASNCLRVATRLKKKVFFDFKGYCLSLGVWACSSNPMEALTCLPRAKCQALCYDLGSELNGLRCLPSAFGQSYPIELEYMHISRSWFDNRR